MRSGSTFLISCLGSHPEILAYDGEIFIDWNGQQGTNLDTLRLYHNRPSRRLKIAKVTYIQMSDPIVAYLKGAEFPVIHLTRENLVDLAISAALTRYWKKRGQDHESHRIAGEPLPPKPKIEGLPPGHFLRDLRYAEREQRRMGYILEDFDVLSLTYEEITGGEDAEEVPQPVARRICEFLGVPEAPLRSPRRKSNRWRPHELIGNWPEIEQLISRSDYRRMLEGNFENC